MNDPLWMPTPGPADLAQRAIERCLALGRFSESNTGITRTFLSPPMHQVHDALRGCGDALGMETSIDAAGNLHGLYRGNMPNSRGPNARRLIIASHLDTVPQAGAYDGILGVVLGYALIEALGGRRLAYDVEVIGFSEEEGVRFGVPFLGSRALAGTFFPDLLSVKDPQGVSVRQAIIDFGLNPDEIAAAAYSHPVMAYLEFHIEQGPVLESLHLPLAIVEAIAGQSRFAIAFTGQANHAGTTPMALRRDALAGAAEWILEVERVGQATPSLVATVGRLLVPSGAGNIVPGRVETSLDVRHAQDRVRLAAAQSLLDVGRQIARRRQLSFEATPLLDQAAVPCDPHLIALLERSLSLAGYAPHTMASGAGHDAMVVAPCFPTAMLFLRSPGGISHHPSETVLAGDVAAAIETGRHFLSELEKEI